MLHGLFLKIHDVMKYVRRIGNDIPVEWSIMHNGRPESLSLASSIKIMVKGDYGVRKIDDFLIDGNVVRWIFRGADQRLPGFYSFSIVINEGVDGMYVVDACNVLQLVAASCMEYDIRDDAAVCVESEIAVPANGLSAYEIAVLHGFKGTEQEWLAFLGTGVRYVEVVLDRDYVIPANPCPGGEVLYCILVGSAVHSVTAEEGVRWLNGILPVPEAESTLVVSVVNNLAVWGAFR